jgi:hypothetical protein
VVNTSTNDLKTLNANVSSWDLPEDLFDAKAGEVRPARPTRKVFKPVKQESKQRRDISQVEVCSRLSDFSAV